MSKMRQGGRYHVPKINDQNTINFKHNKFWDCNPPPPKQKYLQESANLFVTFVFFINSFLKFCTISKLYKYKKRQHKQSALEETKKTFNSSSMLFAILNWPSKIPFHLFILTKSCVSQICKRRLCWIDFYLCINQSVIYRIHFFSTQVVFPFKK